LGISMKKGAEGKGDMRKKRLPGKKLVPTQRDFEQKGGWNDENS